MVLQSCGREKAPFKFHPDGYYYKIISFDKKGLDKKEWKIAQVSLTFKNLSDSVFWDSYNNLSDNFFVRFNTSPVSGRQLEKCISQFRLHDSVCVFIETKTFFREQFNSGVPFFCQKDSMVKINFKITALPSEIDYIKLKSHEERKELGRIIVFFGGREAMTQAKDSSGFYWVEKPEDVSGETIAEGDAIKLSYKGYFLNGRLLEQSPPDFEMVYGTPDQVLKGINYVIGRLKQGQNAKIILPSRLAFGEQGSSDGTVPPHTPLLYEVKLEYKK